MYSVCNVFMLKTLGKQCFFQALKNYTATKKFYTMFPFIKSNQSTKTYNY